MVVGARARVTSGEGGGASGRDGKRAFRRVLETRRTPRQCNREKHPDPSQTYPRKIFRCVLRLRRRARDLCRVARAHGAHHSLRRRAWRDRLEYQQRRAGSRGDSARAATAHEGVARGRHLCFREKKLRQEGSRPRWQASSGRASSPFGEFPRRAPRGSRRPRCTDPSPPRGSGLGPGRPRRTSSGGGARRLARVAREAAR